MLKYGAEYINNLISQLSYINPKSINKMEKDLLNDRLTDGDFCEPKNQDIIMVLLARYNQLLINEGNPKIVTNRSKIIDVINSHVEKCIGYNLRYIENLDREYKDELLKNNKKLHSIKEEYDKNVYHYLPKIIKVDSQAKNNNHALELCKKEGLDENVYRYYSASQELFWLENLSLLTEGYQSAVTQNKHTCCWGPFMKKEIFAIDSDEYLQLYNSLENVIDNLDIEDVNDPRFEFTKQQMGILEYLDADGNPIPAENLTEDDVDEINQNLLSSIKETCDGLVNFMDDFQSFLPRAIYATEGKFLVTRKEFEDVINSSALINLKNEYDVFFYFMLNNGVEISLKEGNKNPTLYELKCYNISEEDMNKVYKYSDEKGNPTNLTYSMIPEDYEERLCEKGQTIEIDDDKISEGR